MVLNPAGYQHIFDFGAPKIISGRAREALSGGQFVFHSGASDLVSSGVNSFDPSTDLLFATAASGGQFVGVVVQNAGSNEPVSVAVDGVFISTCQDTVTESSTVLTPGAHELLTGTTAGQVIGRAYTGAGSLGYTLWRMFG